MPFAEPRSIRSLDDCFFYHAMDLPKWGTVKAESYLDLRGRFEDYTGSVDLRGKRFLEVGAASGFVSFEAEKRGAEVVSFDMERAEQRQFIPGHGGDIASVQNELERLKNAWWLAHAAQRSKARAYYGEIYGMPEELGSFDVVFIGQVLVHLRDPLGALEQAARRCGDTLVITEGMAHSWHSRGPQMKFIGGFPGTYDGWWLLSPELYRQWLALLGFKIERLTRHTHRFVMPDRTRKFRLGTIVARRVHGASSAA
jgi:SAM-dependent methyltransferase